MKQLEKVKSLKDQIYEIIKEDIINQTYQNNTVLNEKKISQELNVSKTPVREALKALEAEGWVEYVPYKGILVKQMSLSDLQDVFRVRKALEVMVTESAEFHGILLKIAGSHLLADLIGQMRDKSKSFGMQAIFASRSRYAETIVEHRRIYDAVAAKDLQEAKSAMASHIDNTYEAVKAINKQ